MYTLDNLFHWYDTTARLEGYGEGVTQLEHASQAAQCAQREKAPVAMAVAAFFHDVGHFVGGSEGHAAEGQSAKTMGIYGRVAHEAIGARVLEQLGFPEQVCALVKGHVATKRYLCAVNPAYMAELSDASRHTLEYQGGPLSAKAVGAFEADPLFYWHIKMRQWDDAAKVPGVPVIPLGEVRAMVKRVLG